MNLPYTVSQTFTIDGKPYNTEQEALKHAIQAIVENHGITTLILDNACELAPLLSRACEIGMAKPAAGC